MAKNLNASALALFGVVAFLLSASRLELAWAADGYGLCKMTESGFIACLPSATGAWPVPSEKCCAALAKADLPCLCKYKDAPELTQMGVKPELAKRLPAACKLTTPTECQ